MLLKKTANVVNQVIEVQVEQIKPNPSQPRVIFNEIDLTKLAASIQQNGILQPITVRATDKNEYEIISGERRLRAAKMASLTVVPCIVISATDKDSAILSILENIQRSDLNFLEEAYAIKNLIEYYELTQECAANKLGVAQSTIANKMRILKLGDNEKAAILKYHLNERQARALLKLPEEQRMGAIQFIGEEQLNTVQADKYVENLLIAKPLPAKKSWVVKQVGPYINSFNHAIKAMKNAGINCVVKTNKTDTFIEYSIKIATSEAEKFCKEP